MEAKKKKALAHFKVNKEELVLALGHQKRYIEVGKAKFNVEKLVEFLDTRLRW